MTDAELREIEEQYNEVDGWISNESDDWAVEFHEACGTLLAYIRELREALERRRSMRPDIVDTRTQFEPERWEIRSDDGMVFDGTEPECVAWLHAWDYIVKSEILDRARAACGEGE